MTGDYQKIESAIHLLERQFRAQPDLRTIAAKMKMSEFHFQRIFSRWAGTSPKRFVQFLTAEHVKARLRESRSVLDAAFDAGLSGPSRVHDLILAVEAMTPGEYKSGGE